MKGLTLTAAAENMDNVIDFVNGELKLLNCPQKAQRQIDIAVDELFSNIARYAYAPDTGVATVEVEGQSQPPAAIITFTDGGMPYNPLTKKDPRVPPDLDAAGNYGIYIVKKSMDDFTYEYKDGKNIVKIKKLFN